MTKNNLVITKKRDPNEFDRKDKRNVRIEAQNTRKTNPNYCGE
jgi:hypothetical protein